MKYSECGKPVAEIDKEPFCLNGFKCKLHHKNDNNIFTLDCISIAFIKGDKNPEICCCPSKREELKEQSAYERLTGFVNEFILNFSVRFGTENIYMCCKQAGLVPKFTREELENLLISGKCSGDFIGIIIKAQEGK